MNTVTVTKRSNELEALEVTDLEEAATFSGGEIVGDTVRVTTPNGFRINARVGDYLVDTGDGMDVYSADAFEDSFVVVE